MLTLREIAALSLWFSFLAKCKKLLRRYVERRKHPSSTVNPVVAK